MASMDSVDGNEKGEEDGDREGERDSDIDTDWMGGMAKQWGDVVHMMHASEIIPTRTSYDMRMHVTVSLSALLCVTFRTCQLHHPLRWHVHACGVCMHM